MTEPKDHSGKRFMKLAGMTARISKDVGTQPLAAVMEK